MPELKPCPFCGSEVDIVINGSVSTWGAEYDIDHKVENRKCPADRMSWMPLYYGANVFNEWNTRADLVPAVNDEPKISVYDIIHNGVTVACVFDKSLVDKIRTALQTPAVTDDAKREALVDEIKHTLEYFDSEFPSEQYPQVWCDPISAHGGGVSPNDLLQVISALQTPSENDLQEAIDAHNLVAKGYKELREKLGESHYRLLEALRIFLSCAYPVSEEINKDGHDWSKRYLNSALPIAVKAITEAEKLQGGSND